MSPRMRCLPFHCLACVPTRRTMCQWCSWAPLETANFCCMDPAATLSSPLPLYVSCLNYFLFLQFVESHAYEFAKENLVSITRAVFKEKKNYVLIGLVLVCSDYFFAQSPTKSRITSPLPTSPLCLLHFYGSTLHSTPQVLIAHVASLFHAGPNLTYDIVCPQLTAVTLTAPPLLLTGLKPYSNFSCQVIPLFFVPTCLEGLVRVSF